MSFRKFVIGFGLMQSAEKIQLVEAALMGFLRKQRTLLEVGLAVIHVFSVK